MIACRMENDQKTMKEMLRRVFKRLLFPVEIILTCVRWYAAFLKPFSYITNKTVLAFSSTIVLLASTSALAVTAPKQVPATPPFDMQSVPLSTATLPPFPYLDWPAKLEDGYRNVLVDKQFDQAFVIVGRTLRAVEGRVERRDFPNDPIGWSAVAAQRNYATAVKNMGGVKVNSVLPGDPDWIGQQGGNPEVLLQKMRLPDNGPNIEGRGIVSYDTYLIRRRQNNLWIVVAETAGGGSTSLLTVEEKALEQSVAPLTAKQLATSLQQSGHVAVYVPFDTDRAEINPASLPIVEQIGKLLQTQPALKLQIEGHTDNVGTDVHNKALSQARAHAVLKAIVAQHIASDRLTAVGFGSSKPIADSGTEEGRAENRRVELVKR